MIDVLFYHRVRLMDVAAGGFPPTQDSQQDSSADNPEPETALSHPALFIPA